MTTRRHMIPRRHRATVLLGVVGFVLAACTAGPSTPAPRPSSDRQLAGNPCRLLRAAEVGNLAGLAIDTTSQNPVSLRSCIWDGGTTTWVTVVADTAAHWSQQALTGPDDASTSAGNLDRSQRRRFSTAATTADGCALFAKLLAIKGVRGTIDVETDRNLEDVWATTARTCARGVFVSVGTIRPKSGPPAPSTLARTAAARVLQRAGG